MVPIDLELLFRNDQNNRWRGGYFEFNEPKAISSMGKSKHKLENVSRTEKSEVVKLSANVPFVDLKDYDIAKKTIHYMQINHVVEEPKIKDADGCRKKLGEGRGQFYSGHGNPNT